MRRDKDYIDSINLEMKTIKDMENLLIEYEKGKISREEYLALTFLSHSQSYSKGFKACFERKSKSKKI